MEDCIFCKIGKGDIPSAKVYEDEEFFAFLDINPVAKGHTLIISKSHFESMNTTPDEMISKIFNLAKILMIKIKETLSCDFVQLDIEGIQVSHFHIHLIPRYHDDTVVDWKHESYSSDKEKEEYIDKIIKG